MKNSTAKKATGSIFSRKYVDASSANPNNIVIETYDAESGESTWKDLRQINKDAIEFLTGVPRDQLNRGVEIMNVSRHSMQHGSRDSDKFELKFTRTERWVNPLMGWTSSRDPLSNLSIVFPSKQAAINFAIHNGFDYRVDDQVDQFSKETKNYGDKFRFKKRSDDDSAFFK
jgi:NADH dehydrogenase (ubiquinone) Fe-S protein 4